MEIFRNFNERIAGNNGLSNHWPRKRGITFEISERNVSELDACVEREKKIRREEIWEFFPLLKLRFEWIFSER